MEKGVMCAVMLISVTYNWTHCVWERCGKTTLGRWWHVKSVQQEQQLQVMPT